MDPQPFFAFSEKIASEVSEDLAEITFRSAINRLYYGIFHWIQQKYHVRIPRNQEERCHAYVKEALVDQVMNDDIVQEYRHLEQKRIESDYHLEFPVTEHDYLQSLRIKDQIIRLVEENPAFLEFEDEERKYFRRRKM